MGVFLVALTTIVAFMPTIIQPFTGGQQNPLVADRLAAQTVDGTLGDPSEPSTLNTTCTLYFFNGSSGDPCSAFDATDSVQEKLGVADTTFVNVTLQANVTGGPSTEIVCAEPGATDLNELGGCSASGEPMVNGTAPPTASGSVTVARRFATLEGNGVFVVVRVWT